MFLKFLIISILLIYIVARFAGYFFRIAYWLMGKPQTKTFKEQQAKPKSQYDMFQQNGLKIFVPKKRRKSTQADEGYVDFEEVKD